MKRQWAALICVLGVSCASPPPRQSLDAPEAWPDRWQADQRIAPASSGDWWESFGDPGLARAVALALSNNFDLAAAGARLEAAAAQARIAGAELYPEVGFAFDANRRQQAFVGLPVPGAAGGVLKSRSTSYGVGLNTSWELDLWGRVRSGKQAALADAQAAQAEWAAAALSVAAQTAKAWLAGQESTLQLELAARVLESYRATAEQVRERYSRGVRSPLDLRLALESVASAEALADQRREQRERALRQIELLLGRYPSGSVFVTHDLPAPPPSVPAGLPSTLLERRPDLVAAERRLAAAGARVDEAKAALFPRISLTASGGRTAADLSDLLSNDFNIWSIAGRFAQPVFQGGRLRAGVDAAQARRREAAAGYLQSALRAFTEVETALAADQWLASREERLAEAARQAGEALKLAEDRYGSGLDGFITVLEAQRRSLNAESQLISARRLRLENRVDLHLALGGGFEDALPEISESSFRPGEKQSL